MKLLVIAATGNLGKAIVNAALRDGHEGAHSFHRTQPDVIDESVTRPRVCSMAWG